MVTPKQKRLIEEGRYRRMAVEWRKREGDRAYLKILSGMEANERYLGFSRDYWRKVLDELDKLPPMGGKQTKEK